MKDFTDSIIHLIYMPSHQIESFIQLRKHVKRMIRSKLYPENPMLQLILGHITYQQKPTVRVGNLSFILRFYEYDIPRWLKEV